MESKIENVCLFFYLKTNKKWRIEILIIWGHNTLHIAGDCLNYAFLQLLCLLMKTESNQAKWGHRRVDYLLPRLMKIGTRHYIYKYITSPGHTPLTSLDQFWCRWRHIIFRYVTSTCKSCFPGMFHFYISDRHKWWIFQRKMWQANPQRGAFLAQWSPMSLTVWAIWKCRQVKLVYIIMCVLQCFPSLSLHYRMNELIKKKLQVFSFIKCLCVWQETFFLFLWICIACAPIISFFFSLQVMKWCKKICPLEKSGLTWLQKWDVRKTNSS